MKYKNRSAGSVRVKAGVDPPPSINPDLLKRSARRSRKKYSAGEFTEAILSGNRMVLSQAITLVESSLQEHYDIAQDIIERCLPYSSDSIRIGITGVPGAGKSTFIETFGLHIAESGRRLAILAVDPSSEHTGGSILGDKTRMEKLSIHPSAFIRPSPSAGSLGGVARKTRETIILCEAAGFNTIIVETVGVGQSETQVSSMVDCFLLLMLAGAGDELQGIKRGIMEMADLVAVTKADGSNRLAAEGTKVSFQNALQLIPSRIPGWYPRVLTCSALENSGIVELWDLVIQYTRLAKQTGYFEEFRKQQAVLRMHSMIAEYLNSDFYGDSDVRQMQQVIEQQLYEGRITSYRAALKLLDKYFKR